jgi:predicted protein tyrosine phosphatase
MMPETLHYLFVCYANMDLNPTAEAVCTRIVRDHNLDIVANSAGISNGANRPVTKHMADLTDKIFVMEPHMATEMVAGYGQNPAKIVCWDILDVYSQNAQVLVQLLAAKMYEHLDREGSI